MKKVLITGANGFVGWYLIRDLLQKKHRVVATGKGPSRLTFQNRNVQYQPLDFTRAHEVEAVFETNRPDTVVHAGALSKPDECELHKEAAFQTNVTGTKNVLAAATTHKSHVLFISTDFVFEGKSLAYHEDDALKPVNYYGLTKKLAEEAVQEYPFDWSIVRPILVYGKPQSGRQNILTTVAQALQRGETPRIFSDQTRMPTYVEDLSRALVTIIEKRNTGIFHICGEDMVTPYAMAVAVARHLGYDDTRIENVTAETFRQPAARPPVTGFDLAKAKSQLQYKPISFADGLYRTFEA